MQTLFIPEAENVRNSDPSHKRLENNWRMSLIFNENNASKMEFEIVNI